MSELTAQFIFDNDLFYEGESEGGWTCIDDSQTGHNDQIKLFIFKNDETGVLMALERECNSWNDYFAGPTECELYPVERRERTYMEYVRTK